MEDDAIEVDQVQWNIVLQQKLINEVLRATQLEAHVQVLTYRIYDLEAQLSVEEATDEPPID